MVYRGSLDSPATSAAAIVPDDDVDLDEPARSVYVGGSGNVAAILLGDTAEVTFVNVTAGTILPIRAARILATGTTATGLVALR